MESGEDFGIEVIEYRDLSIVIFVVAYFYRYLIGLEIIDSYYIFWIKWQTHLKF